MNTNMLSCDFCDKNQSDVYKLIAGPKAYICGGCVWLCVQILLEGEATVVNFPKKAEATND